MSSAPTPNSDLAGRFPGLDTLARHFVTERLDYEYGEPEDAVEAFREVEPKELARSAADGITALLTEFATEEERYAALREMRWGHKPRAGMLDEFLIWTRATLLEDLT
ncbi:MAG: hypothetical protein QOJ79_379 [Actinomycetota bacterium]|jgi:hypothetical protein|nr:hypothetical protein [Actinomycetota bacterium]